MSFEISTFDDQQFIQSVRVGTNGSQFAMLALWFAAYGVAGLPESERVRNGWVAPDWSGLKHDKLDDDPQLPTRAFVPLHSTRDLKAWIGVNRSDCTWVKLDEERIERGLKLKPVSDPNLALLLKLRAECDEEGDYGTISGADVTNLAKLLRSLLPHLQTSCWHETLENVTQVFEAAAQAGTIVRLG